MAKKIRGTRMAAAVKRAAKAPGGKGPVKGRKVGKKIFDAKRRKGIAPAQREELCHRYGKGVKPDYTPRQARPRPRPRSAGTR